MPIDNQQSAAVRQHPGRGVNKSRKHLRGRQVDSNALDEVRLLLGESPRQRDLLIEYFHLIQDKFGYLSAPHLAALAEEMNLPMAEVYECATFYAHFDVVKEGELPPPAVTVRVCDSLSCQLAGAEQLKSALIAGTNPAQVRVINAPCMGRCDTAPVAEVGHYHVDNASADTIQVAIDNKHFHPEIPDYLGYEDYLAGGGYALLKQCLAGDYSWEQMQSVLADANLKGLGGAGFPTASKWQFVRQEPKPRYVAINGDEGEPGTFKDRGYMEADPHRFLEGVLISAWAVEAEAAYIYLRDEYPAVRQILLNEIPKLVAAGLAPAGGIHLRRGAGSYICGEESAMIESIEGKPGLPRHRPPFVAQVGLFGRPTLVNNVETVYWIRTLFDKGADWFIAHGRNGSKGLRSYSVSGRVKNPGVKLAPAGISMQELLDEYCGGMAEGHQFKGYLPGGASGGVLPAAMADIPLDFGTLQPYGCFIGSAAVVVLSDQDNMRDVVVNLLKFFEDESCGQCTPCRVGTQKMVTLLQAPDWDKALLKELSNAMCDASICGLGQAASNPVTSVLQHFDGDLIATDLLASRVD
jgi:NADH:ubiquinone oxidoreductase subunit F (NADH-binding)/NADH:ubiquinone oxidoreductase subunit E